jgi:hypothetical protein
VVSQEPIDRFRNRALYRSSARCEGIVSRRAALFIELSHERGESAVGKLPAACFERLANPPVMVEAVDVERAVTLVRPHLSAAWPEKGAGSEVSPEWVQLVITLHVVTLPQDFRSVSRKPAPRRWPKS